MQTCEEILDPLDGEVHYCAEPPGHMDAPGGFPFHRNRDRSLTWP